MNKLSIIKSGCFFVILAIIIPLRAAGETKTRHSAEYYFQKAMVQVKGGMYDYAVYNLRQCLDADPGRFEAANSLAVVYTILNKKSLAIDYYLLSLKINDRQVEIHCDLAELYEFYSEDDLAFSHFLQAAAIDPRHIRANLSLVRHYLRKKDRAAADRSFKISYDEGRARSAQKLGLVSDALKRDDYASAEKLYGEIIKESPSVIEAYTGLYEIYRKKGDYKRAAETIERLKFIKPDHEKAYVMLGHLYFTQKLPGKRKVYIDRAIKNLTMALELNPQNFDTCITLSRIYDHIGEHLKARELEERANEIDEISEKKKK